ncbi:MAG TPA: PQQ-dependent sugar dehydrogenase [Planctomycetota bacterium]|nr:PQQ-dependent sugar dehydrogenase [Planctomycetota bacterium]
MRRVRVAPDSLLAVAAAVVVLTAFAPRPAAQIQLPEHFEALPLPGTFPLAAGLAFAPDGTLFVVRKNGLVRILSPNQQLQAAPFIDLQAEVNDDHDRGLLSIALHPGFVPDGGPTSWVYLAYTVSPVPGTNMTFNQNQQYSFSRLTRYRALTSGSTIVADPSSRDVLLGHQLPDGSVPDCIASLHSSHSNGALRFARDGTLMFSSGDGAHWDLADTGGNDDPGFDTFIHPVTGLRGPTPKVQDNGAFRSQDLRSLAGKIVRLDPETGLGLPSNPFFDGDPASNASRVWALGLRNPFRITRFPGTGSSDPADGDPGTWIVGDVGWSNWEELNLCREGGDNFGWPCREGPFPVPGYSAYNPPDPLTLDCFSSPAGTLRAPLLAWHHSNPALMTPSDVHFDDQGQPLPGFIGSCAIGGTFYTGGSYPEEYVGRLFFADWLQDWIRTAEFDANHELVAVHDFATGLQNVCGIERHPLTGDLYAIDSNNGIIYRLRYAIGNATPVAVAALAPGLGAAPLLVSFSSTGSFDPDGDPISFDWDFGDGTAHGTQPEVQHSYADEGVYQVTLTVGDQLGLTSTASLTVFVGDAPVGLSLLSPSSGQVFTSPTTLQLDGAAASLDGGSLSYAWTIDLYHDTHVHAAVFSSDQQQAEFPVDLADHGGGVFYYRIELSATNQTGLSASDHVFVYPQAAVADVSGKALLIAKLDELLPPYPSGGGNLDLEVVRDGIEPPAGSSAPISQYVTYHGGQQGQDDWLGLVLAEQPGPSERLVSLRFQEGIHSGLGGWFEDLSVEVRSGGLWSPVENLEVTPAYPASLADEPFFDGTNFDAYELHFDPQAGDAIRVRGDPGGSAGYVSCGELRARLLREPSHPTEADISGEGEIIAKLFSLAPPLPMGVGSKDPETIRNGTWPPVGSPSVFAQFDTFHEGDQGLLDWIGYDFGDTRTLSRLIFQEGQHFLDGGAFTSLGVEVQTSLDGPWSPVPGQSVTPDYVGLAGASYETYVFDFPPMLARAVRVSGEPAGARRYISVGELAAFSPALEPGCGWASYGAPAAAQTLTLESPSPGALGLPIEVRAGGAEPASAGMLGVAFGADAVPFSGGALLLDTSPLLQVPVLYDDWGQFTLSTQIPSDPALVGTQVCMQAFAFDQPEPYGLRSSNGLELTLCAW